MARVQVKCDGRVLWLTLADPEQQNLLTDDALADLLAAIRGWKSRAEILVLDAEGPVFSIGRPKNRPPSEDAEAASGARGVPPGVRNALGMVLELNKELAQWPGACVVAVCGKACGAAAGILVHADVVLAEAGTELSFPEITYDLPPALVNSYLPRWISRKAAHYLVLTGRPVPAETALSWGLVHEVVPPGALATRLADLVGSLQARRTGALRYCKETLLQLRALPEGEAGPRGLNQVLRWLGGEV